MKQWYEQLFENYARKYDEESLLPFILFQGSRPSGLRHWYNGNIKEYQQADNML